MKKIIFAFFSLVIVFTLISFSPLLEWLQNPPEQLFFHDARRPENIQGNLVQRSSDQNYRETIEVGYPYIPGPYYGQPVLTNLLFSHVFGNSYGVPFNFNFSPPEGIEFNRVILTLNTSITDVQYDRLAHLIINGAEIWRTSTIEPDGPGTIFQSTFSKDVSTYLKFFQQESFIEFDLGNIVTPSLQGAQNVQLYVSYYNVEGDDIPFGLGSDLIQAISSKEEVIFSIAKPASIIIPLTSVNSTSSPTKYLPQDTINVNIPSLNQNTTRLILSIFASGNSNEEFWYTNAFLEYVDLFDAEGDTMIGYGPVRVISVYYNGQKVATQIPQAFIFTGGLSPSLWQPIVANDAFDLQSIDIDLTALLPNIWNNDGGHGGNFVIEITNATSPSPSIGSDWIVSANLLTYEHELVIKGSGHVVSITSSDNVSPLGNAPGDGTLYQSISGEFQASVYSNIEFQLKDGSTISSIVELTTLSKVSNVQHYDNYGNYQSVDNVGHAERIISISDDLNNLLYDYKSTFDYPLDVIINATNNTIPTGWSYDIDVNITLSKSVDISLLDGSVYQADVREVGNSIFSMTNSGNQGHGSTSSSYELTQENPFPQLRYNRDVSSVNNTIISDTVSNNASKKRRNDVVVVDREAGEIQPPLKKLRHSSVFP